MSQQPQVFSKVFLILSLCQWVSLVSLIIVILSDSFRNPIQCLMSKPHEKAIETYCYINSVFTFENSPSSSKKYDYYPGIGPLDKFERPTVSHKYFFWMPYFLCFQVFLFGFPRQIWNSLDESLVHHLSCREEDPTKINFSKIKKSAEYFVSTLHYHKSRACIFLGCEALGVLSIFANIFLTNLYLNGRFLNAIPHLLFNILRVDEIDHVYDQLFPKLSKCTFYKFGTSGTITKKDALCVLARNLLTGRIYTLHFAVFATAAFVATSAFTLRILVFLSPKMRQFFILKKMSNPDGSKDDIRYILKFCDFGDWFLLFHLSCTMLNFNVWLKNTTKLLQEVNRTSLWNKMNQDLENH